jgi:hypothetical protein
MPPKYQPQAAVTQHESFFSRQADSPPLRGELPKTHRTFTEQSPDYEPQPLPRVKPITPITICSA